MRVDKGQGRAFHLPPASDLDLRVDPALLDDLARSAESSVLVVLDDDPTGAQSTRDVPMLMSWSPEDLAWGLRAATRRVLFILTNTRSMDADAATRVVSEVTTAVAAASRDAGIQVRLLSRSDSTLRGHFPAETDAIAAAWRDATGEAIDAVVICPAYPEAGRVVLHGELRVWVDGEWLPAADTEFARDASFGYRATSMRDWVEEKSSGRIEANSVLHLDIDTVRAGREAVARPIQELLVGSADTRVISADAVDVRDLAHLVAGLSDLERGGFTFLIRSGPSLVPVRVGMTPATPIEPPSTTRSGVLVIVGSHTSLTDRQVAALIASRRPLVAELSNDASPSAAEVASWIDAIGAGRDVVLTTSRTVLIGPTPEDSLAIARNFSATLVAVARRLLAAVTPAAVIAKGGITSHDIATRALDIRRAWVLGPLLPGAVSLIQPYGPDGAPSGAPFTIFPGNVGDETSLLLVVQRLTKEDR